MLTVLAISLAVALLISLILNLALWKRKLPFPDYGSFAYCCRDEKAWLFLIHTLRNLYGIAPTYRHDSDGINRALYEDMILNANPAEFMERLGNPGGGPVFPSTDPWDDACRLKSALQRGGYEASVIVEDNSVASVCLVRTNLMIGAVIGFRKRKWTMSKPPAWHA